MFCTTVIPTIGRPSLTRAVTSVLSQNFSREDYEIIVVNDSPNPLPEHDWQRSPRVKVIQTGGRERIVARNSGAAISKGRYLHFLDDDDMLLPGALENMYQLAKKTDAKWLYGCSQLLDRRGNALIQLHHNLNGNCFVQIMAGEWVPLQSSFIESQAFFHVGGFAHNCLATQDVDLCRRIALFGDLAGTEELVACIGMGTEGSSTDYKRGPAYSRRARENILNEAGVWSRLRSSAYSSEWWGRIWRIYLTSTIWNLENRKFFTAFSRATYSLVSLLSAGVHVLSPGFWRAVFTAYKSPTFEKGFSEVYSPVHA